MESITTTILIETDNPKKAFKFVDKMVRKGFTHQSTNMESQPTFNHGRYKIELTKLELFK